MGRKKEVLIEKGKSGMEEGKEKTEGGGEGNTEGKSEGLRGRILILWNCGMMIQ